MKRKLLLSLFSVFCSLIVYCQLYNNGATITVQNGGYLMIAGNLQNASGLSQTMVSWRFKAISSTPQLIILQVTKIHLS